MMNKIRSARLHLLKFLFVLPLAAVLLVAFRDATKVERTSVDKLYGQLPERVPPPANNTDEKEKAAGWPVRSVTGSGSAGDAAGHMHKKDTVPNSGTRKLPTNVLYVLDGEPMPAGWTADRIPADSIGSVVVLQAGKALTFFGPRGENGAIVLRTKAYEAAHPMVVKDDEKPKNPPTLFRDSALGERPPLWVVDGQIWSHDSVRTLDPERIEHIYVHKPGDEYTKQYGEKGKNGVVVIALKKEVVIFSPAHQQLTAAFVVNGEPFTITADTLRVSRP